MATTYLKLNGTDWASKISEVTVQPRQGKAVRMNLRGDSRTIPSRSSLAAYKIQLTFPFCNAATMTTLWNLYNGQVTIAVDHNMDFPAGNYKAIDFAKTRISSLNAILYHVIVTLSFDAPVTLPVPTNPGFLAAGGITKYLGL
jgi:hypothetical protein